MIKEISTTDFIHKLKNERDKLEIIDVREPNEYENVRIIGSKLIPMRELGDRLNEIDWNKEVIFICRTGNRSGKMAQLFTQAGFNPINLSGGITMVEVNCKECVEKSLIDSKFIEKI